MDVLSFGVCVKRCVQTGVKSQRITVIGRRISGQIDVSKSLLGVMQWIFMISVGVQIVNSLLVVVQTRISLSGELMVLSTLVSMIILDTSRESTGLKMTWILLVLPMIVLLVSITIPNSPWTPSCRWMIGIQFDHFVRIFGLARILWTIDLVRIEWAGDL